MFTGVCVCVCVYKTTPPIARLLPSESVNIPFALVPSNLRNGPWSDPLGPVGALLQVGTVSDVTEVSAESKQ